MLLIAALVLCSGISESSAQPTCCSIGKCGQWPNCYDPPKVPCNAGQRENVLVNYCGPSLNKGLCNPGVFICISDQIPDGYSCSCNGANNCKYINIRNLVACNSDGTGNDDIIKVELKLHKDSSSTKWTICSPLTQWGQSPWTSMWRIFIGAVQFNSGQCNNQNNWGIDIQKFIEIKRPLSGGSEDANYNVQHLQHWTAVVCGASEIDIRLTWTNGGQGQWITGLPINTVACPEYGSDNGWCFKDPDDCPQP